MTKCRRSHNDALSVSEESESKGKPVALGNERLFILCVLAVVSVILLVEFGWLVPAAVTLCFAFLTIRKEDMTVLDYIRYAVRYFLTDQQYYEWRE